ncbi:MAG: bluetail domain-containing putative surface protein [Acidovorax sp.]|nr:bluetail domain-containing putative surface protein [Acidovorax sp.]
MATKVGIQNSLAGGALNIGFAGASGAFDSASIVLADAAGADAITVNAIETLTIDSKAGTVASTTVNHARIAADAAQLIVIRGGQGLTTTVTGEHIGTIDASALSGALNLGFATTGTGTVGIMGGTAGDTLIIDDASGARLVFNSGDGDDVVTIGASNAHIVTLGRGADTLHIGGLAGAAARDLDTSTSQALGWSAIWVTDFENGVNTVRLTAAGTTVKAALGEAQLASIAASASLLDAAALAATTAGAHKAVAFRYGADTYILVNDAATALGANDSLIKLSGVVALADASWAVA